MRISVITPSYNQAGFVERTLQSVLCQRGDFELEYIVVDGGSADGTVDILHRYGSAIRWVSEPDEGQADALNKGVSMASGDVIGWLNSDDVYEPDTLDVVASVFRQEREVQWLYGKVRIIDSEGSEIRRWITHYKNWRMRRFSYEKLLAENFVSQMGVFWRRSAGRVVGPFCEKLRFCMDYDYWLRLGKRWPGRYVDQYLAAFRWYATSKSGSGFWGQFREELDVAREHANGQNRRAMVVHHLTFIRTVAAYELLGCLRRWHPGALARSAAVAQK